MTIIEEGFHVVQMVKLHNNLNQVKYLPFLFNFYQ
uniref:Uncharacterized protein n=1 Tax=Arundo donax TaxID=35708 RepID=A0A0A9FVX2_ARUDO